MKKSFEFPKRVEIIFCIFSWGKSGTEDCRLSKGQVAQRIVTCCFGNGESVQQAPSDRKERGWNVDSMDDV
ncbi:hypothetical protein L2E82_46512 [Cichorium intybus]|uniref:Uncharacterized protein n=1 Tax=Cichorium intybus TaxID=13427 RepID=A0ACB8YTL1_CICIN|nr:hypothetical protein L2E82_46512 [Cichorium intybus]